MADKPRNVLKHEKYEILVLKNQQYTHLRKLKWLYLQYYIVYYSIVFYEVLEG